ncbi:DUF2156 domain-containing protein [Clostridium sp. WILCCON 0269]|uniref:DUF2156 domain-containing protein n=1 Tax=Candidatus Clostridium eludens TaxID=3381663 RepID=A0ABW8SNI8_9CLOT
MLIFKPITIDDKSIFDKYLINYNFNTSEYSFTSLIIWRKGCDIKYTIYEDTLIIKKKDFNGNYHFMQPIGYTKNNVKNVVEKLIEYREKNTMTYLFKDVEETFLNDLKEAYGESIYVKPDTDNFDYIYTTEKLITLSGKKLHSKKNHYNYFTKTYNYVVKDFYDLEVKSDIINAAEDWYKQKNICNEYLKYEFHGIEEIVFNMEKLNLKAMAVYVDNNIASFTIGEKVNPNMAIIHIEKGSSTIRGIYTFTNKTFVENYLSDVKYINREQDLGIEGLRKAKRSYQPVKMEEKYCISL